MSGTVGLPYRVLALTGLVALAAWPAIAAEPTPFAALDAEYARATRPALRAYCLGCHSTEDHEGDLDLERFAAVADARAATRVWQKVAEQLDNGEMPPKDAETKLPAAERARLRDWVGRFLKAEAYATAGDPGPVVLRRLNNAEYTYTIRDLTGVALSPAREFPADGAAGEGFTNTGHALVMSPALFSKYLDAAKDVAAHAVLLPDGLRFSPSTTRRDWTDAALRDIRALYARYADADGKLPLAKYLAATLEEREALRNGGTTVAAVAAARGLNARYLAALWSVLNDHGPSPVLDGVRARWRAATPGDLAALVAEVAEWQKALSEFQKVGHMKPWVVPVNPVTTRQFVRFKFPESPAGGDVTVYLSARDAGDGDSGGHGEVIWQQPRLVADGRPDLPLRDVRGHVRAAVARRERVFQTAASCLAAAAEAIDSAADADLAALARRHGVDADVLDAWLNYLGVGPGAAVRLDLLTVPIAQDSGHDFVKGWGSPGLPNLVTNSSDRAVRIPGNLKPHGVAVHPVPTLAVAVGWRSPVAATLKGEATVTHAHPECGNGVAWSLELRRGATRQRLASGFAAGAKPVKVGPVGPVAARPGDLVSLVIGPRDGNHACDLTDLEFTLSEDVKDGRVWDLTRDVAGDVLAGNPHADRFGHAGVWQFYREPVQGGGGPVIPAGSVLARWLATPEKDQKRALAADVQALLTAGPPAARDHPDALLRRQLASLGGPLLAGLRASKAAAGGTPKDSQWGLDPSQFGRAADGAALDPHDLSTTAPAVVAVRLPADLVAGCELVASAVLRPTPTGGAGAQVRLLDRPPDAVPGLRPDAPVLVAEGATAKARMERAFDDCRRWFPAALCYTKIVPVDEVVTLTLFHREDGPLRRLMLDDAEAARLDRSWDELHFVSRDALTLVDAYAQLMEYATQDSDPKLFEPYRKPIHDRAAAFRKAVVDAEPKQVDAVVAFAGRAYRRPLSDSEAGDLRGLYQTLRTRDVPHEEAARLTLARVLVAPAFLYRIEAAGPGAKPSPVSDWELATRLSYFLWSSCPDDELRGLAASGRLHDPDVLAAQARRLLRDDKVRRLATEFACQWLHVYEFDAHDEKSERHFPTFASLRGDMYEETIRFFQDLCQRDAAAATVFDADTTYLNEALAKHYGIAGVTGPAWRRVEGLRAAGRGGILGLSTTLAAQSGASRTSPILRGNWVSEVLLGEKLPKPPKGVPVLPDDEAAGGGKTVRQLVETHTRDARCSGCHARIDPFGFALEGFDAIGRRREKDLGDRPVDTRTTTPDGAAIEGLDGLRNYLLTTRRDAVCRQFSRKLLGYALGRGVRLSDEPLVDDLARRIGTDDARLSTVVEAIVLSRQFREVRGRDAADAP